MTKWLLFGEGETQLDLHPCANMHNCIGEATIEDDIHAYPHIHRPKDSLMIFLVLASVVQEDPMQELIGVDVGEWDDLDLLLAVTT